MKRHITFSSSFLFLCSTMSSKKAASGQKKAQQVKPTSAEIKKAVVALHEHKFAKAQNTTTLIEDDEQFHLVLGFHKMIPGKAKPSMIPIPNTIYGREGASVCLIVKDPSTEYLTILEDSPIKNINTVIPISTLRRDYTPYQNARQLAAQHDLFISDDRVSNVAQSILGKTFIRLKKHPFPVSFRNFAKNVTAARDSTYFFRNQGVCSSIKVGHQDSTPEEVCANIEAVLKFIRERCPDDWKNIRTIGIKSNLSSILPFYVKLLNAEEFNVDTPEVALEKQKLAEKKELFDKLSKQFSIPLELVERYHLEAIDLCIPTEAVIQTYVDSNVDITSELTLSKLPRPAKAKTAAFPAAEKDAKKVIMMEDGESDMEEDFDEDMEDFDEDMGFDLDDEDALEAFLMSMAEDDEDMEEEEEDEEEIPVVPTRKLSVAKTTPKIEVVSQKKNVKQVEVAPKKVVAKAPEVIVSKKTVAKAPVAPTKIVAKVPEVIAPKKVIAKAPEVVSKKVVAMKAAPEQLVSKKRAHGAEKQKSDVKRARK